MRRNWHTYLRESVQWWKFWDPRSGLIGGLLFSCALSIVIILSSLLWRSLS